MARGRTTKSRFSASLFVLGMGVAVLMLCPPAVRSEWRPEPRTDCGQCYVEIWEDENFEDDYDKICGPGKWANMRRLPGAHKEDWGDEIDSLKVGKAATVDVWEDEDFKDNHQTYGPGSEKTNLRGNPDMGDQIDSMEIKCQ